MSTLLHYTRGQLLSSINTTFNSEPPSLRRHVGNLQLGTMYFSHIVTQPLTEQALSKNSTFLLLVPNPRDGKFSVPESTSRMNLKIVRT